jgi:alkylhydroperoxidase family enzyme
MGEKIQIGVDLVEDSTDPVVLATFERLEARSGIGMLHRTLANSPDVFASFVGLAQALRYSTQIDPVDRELAICAVLERHEGHYELAAHRRFAAIIGATQEQIDNVSNRDCMGVYTERQEQILRFAAQLAADPGELADLPPSRIEEWLDNRERIELGLTLALYMGLAHFTALFAVPAEDFERDGAPSLSRAAQRPA